MQETKETWVWSLSQKDSLEEGMATHSRILAWRIPWTEEPGRLQPIGSHRGRHNWSDLAHTACICQSQSPNLSLLSPSPLPTPGSNQFVFYICNSISVFKMTSFVLFFLKIPHVSNIIYLSFPVWLHSALESLDPSMLHLQYSVLLF